MNEISKDALLAANGRTFEQIACDDFGGNITALLRACGIKRKEGVSHAFQHFLHGRCTATFCGKILREIACALGGEVDSLFPPRLYKQQIFSSIRQAPGFQLVTQRFHIQFHGKNHLSLWTLFQQKGFGELDYDIFCKALLGYFTPDLHGDRLQKIARALESPMEELFPPDIYEHELAARTPFERRVCAIDENHEAQNALKTTVQSPESATIDRREALQQFLAKVLRCLTAKQRTAYEAHFLAGEGQTLADTAKQLGWSEKRTVDERLRTGRERLFKNFPELAEEWDDLKEGQEDHDRVFI